jgi:hypothetical protein
MGCPDAVRAELLNLTGILAVTYHPGPDLFAVRFESVLVDPETIFATIRIAGQVMGREYRPETAPSKSSLAE